MLKDILVVEYVIRELGNPAVCVWLSVFETAFKTNI
jgi:hypothetical protein